jgi:hypothetical protein
MRCISLVWLLAAALGLHACSTDDAGVDADTRSEAVAEVPAPLPVKLDVLLVIDDTGGMCWWQMALTEGVESFLARLGQVSRDVRVAVTTTDVRSEGFRGTFRTGHASEYGPACQVNRPKECTTDAQCAGLEAADGPGWECTWEGKPIALTVNDNGSLNSSCHKTCTTDDECTAVFGDLFHCSVETPGAVGCRAAPPVEGCPETLGPVLTGTDIAGLRCLVNVGDTGTPEKNLEGGLKAALLALDRGNDPCTSPSPNVCRLFTPERLSIYAADCPERLAACGEHLSPGEPDFLRDDAWLLVVFASNEDDCSDRDDNPFSLNDTKLCAFKGEQLLPLPDVVQSLKALKTDPAHVIVAGLVGDAVIGGTRSCLVSDRCLVERTLDECRCYAAGGDRAGCPAVLATGTPDALCNGQGLTGAEANDELAYRLACLDACLGRASYNPAHTCSKLVDEFAPTPEGSEPLTVGCGCYAAEHRGSEACQAAFADEPTYRVGCERACFHAAKLTSTVQPNTAPGICEGVGTFADLGTRYLSVLEAFGDHGLGASLCDPRGLRAVLEEVAARAAALISADH